MRDAYFAWSSAAQHGRATVLALTVLAVSCSPGIAGDTKTSGVCAAETDTAFCARQLSTCGATAGMDNCGAVRAVSNCGTCPAPSVCGGGDTPNACGAGTCTPEDDVALCVRLHKGCGQVTVADNCGTLRSAANCGTCTSPQTCGGGGTANTCGTSVALTVTISPVSAKVAIGAHRTFSGAVTGGTNPDKTIVYSVIETGCGTVSSAGDYAAPATAPATTCTVRATNPASGLFAEAKVTVVATSTGPKTVTPPAMNGEATTIAVNFNNVLATSPDDFMGINGTSFWDSDPLNANTRNALKAAGIKIIRYPGGVPGNRFDWSADTKACNSSSGATSPTVLQAWQYASAADCSIMFQTNPFTSTVGGCVNDTSGSHAAAWVTYAAANNMSAPYWEIGNEPEGETNPINAATAWGASGYSDISLNYAYYLPIFDKQAVAMHAANPAIKIFGPVGANIWYWRGCNGLEMFLKAEGNKQGTGQADGVSLHWYPSSENWDTIKGVTSSPFYVGVNFIYSKIFEYDDRDLPVIITETSMSNSGSDATMPQKIAAAIGTADLLGAYARVGIEHVTWFSGRGATTDVGFGAWGTIDDTTGRPTAAFYVFVLWSKMGPQVVDHVQGVDNTQLVVYATKKSASSVQLMVINKTAAALVEKLAFDGFAPSGTTAITVNQLSAPSGKDYNSTDFVFNAVTNPSTPWTSIPAASLGGTYTSGMTYSFPPYSITVLDFSS